MYTDTINKCAANAARINRFERSDKLGFWLSSAMAVGSRSAPVAAHIADTTATPAADEPPSPAPIGKSLEI